MINSTSSHSPPEFNYHHYIKVFLFHFTLTILVLWGRGIGLLWDGEVFLFAWDWANSCHALGGRKEGWGVLGGVWCSPFPSLTAVGGENMDFDAVPVLELLFADGAGKLRLHTTLILLMPFEVACWGVCPSALLTRKLFGVFSEGVTQGRLWTWLIISAF